MNAPSISDVSTDPEWIPHTYDVEGANLTFVHVPREDRDRLMFLSDEHFAGGFAKCSFPTRAVAAESQRIPSGSIHFIFHTSYCCSTLLAKALDLPGKAMVLKEPDICINLANRVVRSDDRPNRDRLDLVLRLLQRPSATGESVIVKPSNFGNRLIDLILAQRSGTRAVLLYSDLATFLRSLLKRGMFGRIFGRKLFAQLGKWSPVNLGYTADELWEQTDVQIAGLAWLMQIHHFDAIARRFGPGRVLILDSSRFLEAPEASLKRVSALFGLDFDENQIDRIVAGEAFSKHSKFSDRGYSAEQREEEHRAAAEIHSEEISMVVQWIETIARQAGLPLRPGE